MSPFNRKLSITANSSIQDSVPSKSRTSYTAYLEVASSGAILCSGGHGKITFCRKLLEQHEQEYGGSQFPAILKFFRKRGFNVESFGSGSQVKLPGPTPDRPNCYDFGVATYDFIYNDLKQKDPQLYTQNGLLNMLDRNRRIKDMPQKFQHFNGKFDVIICLEERVYDQIVDDLQTRDTNEGDSVHVINIDIQDNHEEATIGALFVCDLCAKLEACEDLDNEIDEVLTEFEQNNSRRNILHTICFY